jgi:hypothetical protein
MLAIQHLGVSGKKGSNFAMAIIQGWGNKIAVRSGPRGLAYRLFVTVLGFVLLAGCLVITLERRENFAMRSELVAIRESLRTEFTGSAMILETTPAALLHDGFLHDRPEQIARFRAQLMRSPHYAHALVAIDAEPDEIKKAQLIVQSFSTGGGGAGIYRLPLLEKMQYTLKGDGCCSDHAEIFLAMASACGLFAREIQNDRHSFASFYSVTRRKWIYIDPLLAVMATDERGNYLSTLEIRDRRLLNQPLRYLFFGKGSGHAKSTDNPVFQGCYGSLDRFRRIAMAFGNNVLSEDKYEQQLGWAPWELQKTLSAMAGAHPYVVSLADRYNQNEVRAVQTLRREVWGGGLGIATCLSLYPLQQLCRLAARLRQPAPLRRIG